MEYTRLVTGKTVAVLFEKLGYRYVIYLYAAQTNYLTCLCTVLLKRNVNMHCLKKRPIEILNKWCHLMGGFLLQETELDIFISISLRMRRVHSTWKAVIIWTVCPCFVVRTIYYMVFEIAPPPTFEYELLSHKRNICSLFCHVLSIRWLLKRKTLLQNEI